MNDPNTGPLRGWLAEIGPHRFRVVWRGVVPSHSHAGENKRRRRQILGEAGAILRRENGVTEGFEAVQQARAIEHPLTVDQPTGLLQRLRNRFAA